MRHLVLLCSVMTVVALVACGDDARSPPPAPIAVKKAAPAPVADAGVIAGTPYVYTYSAIGKRDPFRNLLAETTREAGAKTPLETLVCDEPLCAFDVDELNLVAVISGDANPVAMVEDRTGIGHIVHRNTKIGKQGGKVTSILRDCIVVTSFVQGPDGKAQPNRTNLCVKQAVAAKPVLDLMQGKVHE